MRLLTQTFIICIFILFLSVKGNAQPGVKVQGYVLDVETGMPIEKATVSVIGSSISKAADKAGYFSFFYNRDTVEMIVTHLNYDTLQRAVTLPADTLLMLSLHPKRSWLQEVTISGKAGNVTQTIEPGTLHLSKRDLEKLPSFMGQKDPVKAIQTLPGIGNAGEGNSALLVRGGTAGQNLTIFNGATVYNPSHLLGFFSIFNADAVDNVRLYKSGIPAEYGGRLSSVLEVNSGKRIKDSLTVGANISVLGSNLSLDVPLSKNWSISTAVRKTYMGYTVWPLMSKINTSSFFEKINYDFYDLNVSSNATLSKKDKLSVSFYTGGDDFGFDIGNFGISNTMSWNNTAGSVKWSSVLNGKAVMNHTLTYSGYDFDFGMGQDNYQAGINSSIREKGYKGVLDLYLHKHKLKAGTELLTHKFIPNSPFANSSGTELDYGSPNTYFADEASLFISDEFTLSDKISVYGGLRYTYFRHKGPYSLSNDESGNMPTRYGENKTVSDYHFVEPRLIFQGRTSETSSVKLSFTRNIQPLHLISITAVNFPADFWMPSLKNVQPEKGFQVSTGYYKDFGDGQYESYADFYFKDMHNLTEFSGGIMNMLDNVEIEKYLLFGKGNAYGGELYIKKKSGRLTGWISYSLSKSNRKFPEINEGKSFPAKYDRRHDLSAVALYKLNQKWALSSAFVYATGNAYTQPVSRYMLAGNIVNEYGPFNGARMPAYHRMDVGATYSLKETNRVKNTLVFSVYNLYGRQNPIYTFFQAKGNLSEYRVSIEPKSVSLMPILPSISWSYEFK